MSERVLIIEDSRDYAENLAELLGDEGYEVATVGSVAAAIAHARDEGFDIALLDVRLPDALGTDALATLRAVSPTSEVIVMSGDATIDTAIAAVRGGAMAYLLKPAQPEELLQLTSMAAKQVGLRRERELLLKRLAASEAGYRGLVETSPTLVLGYADDGAIVLFNAACESATGFSRDEMLGRPVTDVLPGALVGATKKRETKDLLSDERVLRTRDGGERRVLWQQTVIEGVTYAFGMDRTEPIELERRAQAAERLAAAGQLTAGLAHEVRNPLNAALLLLKVHERALEKQGLTEGLDSVALIRGELERLQRLTHDFLELARPRAPTRVAGDLREAVEAVAFLVAAEATDRRVHVRLELDEQPVLASFDGSRIRQVILNLVGNALEVIPEGGHVLLRARRSPGRVHVEVEDDGPGIPDDVEQVFNPFYTTKATGTGLGLSIARRIVVDHHGELTVASQPGRTVFTLTLPAPA